MTTNPPEPQKCDTCFGDGYYGDGGLNDFKCEDCEGTGLAQPQKAAELEQLVNDMWTAIDDPTKARPLEKRWLEYIDEALAARAQLDTPMGASAWEAHGRKYGYWDFFEEKQNERFMTLERRVTELEEEVWRIDE